MIFCMQNLFALYGLTREKIELVKSSTAK